MVRLALAPLLLLLTGAVTGLATVAVHQVWWGMLLAVAGTLLALRALAPGWPTRLPFALGWAGLVGWVAPTRPEGDFVLSSDPGGYGVLLLAAVVLVWSLATLPRPGRALPGAGPVGS